MRRQWLVVSGISVLAELYLLYHLPAVLLAATFLIGRSDCSFSKTVALAGWRVQYDDASAKMARDSRLVTSENGLELWRTPRGAFWVPKGGMGPMLYGVLAEQELQVYGVGSSGVHAGDVVIDCGADFGTFTRSALEMGASLVIAVEPAPEKHPALRRTFQREIAEGKVVIFPKGVWNREELLPLYGDSVVEKRGAVDAVVPLTTIDNLVIELRLKRVDFIKMDIEGAEKEALEGARAILNKFRPRLAISSEHFSNQANEIRQSIRNIAPSYISECGPCSYLDGRICPHVYYFH